MKKVIVTGATGFIGFNLVNALLEKGYNVLAIVHRNSQNINRIPKSPSLKIIELDVDEISKLSSMINEEYDVFINLAWVGTKGDDRNIKELQDSNHGYTLETISVAHQLGCKTFIGAGSQAEYGICNEQISELTECNPVTAYGKAKLWSTIDGCKLCEQYNMDYKWSRIFSIYGPGDYQKTLVISLIDKMLLNEDINLTKCIQKWNYLYVKDAVEALIKLFEVKCVNGIYNIGGTDNRELKDFINEISKLIDTKSRLNYGAVSYPETGMVSIQPSVDKLINETNWKPATSFEEGIKEIIIARKKILNLNSRIL